ncbi:MAG: discoidin domain-containing protein, partial [Planctomycetota bacterium]
AFRDGRRIGHDDRRNFTVVTPTPNLALGKPVTSSRPSAAPFSVERLTDGGTENLGFYLGYSPDSDPIVVTVDLERPQTVGKIVVHAYTISGSFEKYVVEVSADGTTFEEVGRRTERPDSAAGRVVHAFDPRSVRYVRIRSFGNRGYVFDSFSKLTEIQVFE